MRSKTSAFRRALVGTVSCLAIAAFTPAHAQERSQTISIASQSLGDAINALSRQTGVVIISPSELVEGRTSPQLTGRLSTEDALERILAGTGLTARQAPLGTFTIQRSPPQRGRASDGTIRPSDATNTLEDVVVTGTRLLDGFETPTPVTFASIEELRSIAPGSIADGLNLLPVFTGGAKTVQATGGGLASGTVGQNILNMRSLGPNRALVLLNGERIVSSNETGSVDINIIPPQALLQRVEVVTGGASAVYGSDAVAGVINFVLDANFEGLKFESRGGLSGQDDAGSYGASVAAGRHLIDGRLRLIGSVELEGQDGIGIFDKPTGRDWYDTPDGQIPNPEGTIPAVLVVPDLRAALGSYGGLISSGPLRGTQFLAGGVSAPFQYGYARANSTYMSGGDALAGDPGTSLSTGYKRTSAFTSAEYDLTPELMAYGTFLYSRSETSNDASINFGTGSGGQLTIFRDNAFLPSDVLSRMVTSNVLSIPIGRYYTEFGPVRNESITSVHRLSLGLSGELFTRWNWNLSYIDGETAQFYVKSNQPILRNFFAASDAVRDPTGQIVCRSTLAGFDPGCVPLNPFGLGSVSQASADFVLGDSSKELTLHQTIVALNVNGDLGERLHFGAGPIKIAAGLEYRQEEATQTADPISQQVVTLTGLRTGAAPTAINGRLGGFQFFNPQPFSGSYEVSEGFVEVGLPLLRDHFAARSLDANLALRVADYSQSGEATTWKYGLSWTVTDQLRLRYTKSRDIRGPNVVELFNTQTQQNQNVLYQGNLVRNVVLRSGNPSLDPERSLTETFGVIYTPSWMPDFRISLDRYSIEIEDAIGSLTGQETINQCQAGNQLACEQFTVQPDASLITRLRPLNLSEERNAGYDLEASYNRALWGGEIGLRLLLNHTTDGYRVPSPGSMRVLGLGFATLPAWRGLATAEYDKGAWHVSLSESYIGSAFIDPNLVEGVNTNDNGIPEFWMTNLTVSHDFGAVGVANTEGFVTISNLFDREPPFNGGNPSSYNQPQSTAAYDVLGRYFTVGLRLTF